jgi:hypothetical protein
MATRLNLASSANLGTIPRPNVAALSLTTNFASPAHTTFEPGLLSTTSQAIWEISSVSSVTNPTNYGVYIKDFFVSRPVQTQVTITSDLTCQLRAQESSMSANATARLIVAKLNPNGQVSLISDIFNPTELPTAYSNRSATAPVSGGSVTLNPGDRIVAWIAFMSANGTTMSGGYSLSVYFDTDPANYNWVEFVESISFIPEYNWPNATTLVSLPTLSDLPGLYDMSYAATANLNFQKTISDNFATEGAALQYFSQEFITSQLQSVVLNEAALVYITLKDVTSNALYPLIQVFKTDQDGGNAVLVGSGFSSGPYSTPAGNTVTLYVPIYANISNGERLKFVYGAAGGSSTDLAGVVELVNASVSFETPLLEYTGGGGTSVPVSQSATVTLSDSISTSASIPVSNAATATLADSVATTASIPVTNTSTVTLSDSITVGVAKTGSDSATVTLVNSILTSASVPVINSTTVTLSDSVAITTAVPLTNASTVTIADSISVVASIPVTNAATVSLSESVTTSRDATNTSTVSLTDSISIAASIPVTNTSTVTLVDSVSVDSGSTNKTPSQASTITLADSISVAVAIPVTNAATVTLVGSSVVAAGIPVTNASTVTLSDSVSTSASIPVSNTSTVGLVDSISTSAAIPVTNASTVTLSDSITGAGSSSISPSHSSTLTLADSIVVSASIPITNAATVTLSDSISGAGNSSVNATNASTVTLVNSISVSVALPVSDGATVTLVNGISSIYYCTCKLNQRWSCDHWVQVLERIFLANWNGKVLERRGMDQCCFYQEIQRLDMGLMV